jgi:hypothetical protein
LFKDLPHAERDFVPVARGVTVPPTTSPSCCRTIVERMNTKINKAMRTTLAEFARRAGVVPD